MVSSLGTSPLVSLPTMLFKKENTALFLVININAANDQGKQKSTKHIFYGISLLSLNITTLC